MPCREFYAAEIEAEALEEDGGFFTQEYVNTKYEWICPNMTQIDLLNDVSTDIAQIGAIIEARVYACPRAQILDDKYGLVSYADVNGTQTCKGSDEIQEETN